MMWTNQVAGLALVVLFATSVSAQTPDSSLKKAWKEITAKYGEWGVGIDPEKGTPERRGQICDPTRRFGDAEYPADPYMGCSVVFISDPTDDFTVKNLPANQQNNFQNTQHYNAAWNFHREGFKGDSLPRSNQDINPVCYIAKVNGQVVLGYEEGNGDALLPCPGNEHGFPFTEAEILDPNADLVEMCSMCYQAVCTGRSDPRACGSGVEVGDDGEMIEQATPAYHCHLTMASEGACDYVQFHQHEYSREYYMNYSVLCGWENIREMNLTYCDCTAVAGTANNCGRQHCLDMAATAGVACGNCGGCSRERSRDGIFTPIELGPWNGHCAAAQTAATQDQKDYHRMLCSRGLFCRRGEGVEASNWESLTSSGCEFHCSVFTGDEYCKPETTARSVEAAPEALTGSRKMLSFLGIELDSKAVTLDTRIPVSAILPEHPVIPAKYYRPKAAGVA